MPPMPGTTGFFPQFPPHWMPSLGLPTWWDLSWWIFVVLSIGGLWRLFIRLAVDVDVDNAPDLQPGTRKPSISAVARENLGKDA